MTSFDDGKKMPSHKELVEFSRRAAGIIARLTLATALGTACLDATALEHAFGAESDGSDSGASALRTSADERRGASSGSAQPASAQSGGSGNASDDAGSAGDSGASSEDGQPGESGEGASGGAEGGGASGDESSGSEGSSGDGSGDTTRAGDGSQKDGASPESASADEAGASSRAESGEERESEDSDEDKSKEAIDPSAEKSEDAMKAAADEDEEDPDADVPASVGQNFMWTSDEGVDIVFRVTGANTVQVGSGSPGKTTVINRKPTQKDSQGNPVAREFTTVNSSYAGALTIPETIDYAGSRYRVTAIAPSAFGSYYEGFAEITFKLGSVSIPDTVTSIGSQAFYKAALSMGVAFGESPTVTQIGANAFAGTSLPSFSLPASVTQLGESAFRNSKAMATFTFPAGCKVSTLPAYVFADCASLRNIEVPASVSYIAEAAFMSSGLTSFTLPKTVSRLGPRVFAGSALSQVTFQQGSPITEIPTGTFASCKNLASFTFPSWIESIENDCFYESGLRSITIPTTLTYLGEGAFAGCMRLSSVAFEEGHQLLNISKRLFSECTALVTLTLPENIRSVGDNAFSGCTALSRIAIPSKVGELGEFSFQECTALRTVIFEGDVSGLVSPASAFYLANNVTSVVFYDKRSKNVVFRSAMPTTYYSINYYATPEDREAGNLYRRFVVPANSVPQEVTEDEAFSGRLQDPPEGRYWVCEKGYSFDAEITDTFWAYGEPRMADLAVGDTFTADTVDGATVTYTVTSLPTADSPGTASVGSAAGTLAQTPAIDPRTGGSVTIPNRVVAPDANTYAVTAIQPYSFANANRISAVTIPASVTDIGAYAFYRATTLRDVYFESDASKIVDNGIFAGCANIKLVVFGGKKANVSFGASSPDVYYTVFYYDSEHDRDIGNVAATVIAHERTLMASPTPGQIRSGEVPPLKLGYQWHYEDGFAGDKPLTDSTWAYMEGMGLQATIRVVGGNVSKTPCWFKVISVDEETGTGTVSVGLGKDGITAVHTGVSGMPIIPRTITVDGIEYTVTEVGPYAFGASYQVDACQYITSVGLPATIETIEERAFSSCHSLKTAMFPAGLTTLGASAFEDCTGLSSVTATPATGLSVIGDRAFAGDYLLESFVLPAGVTRIGAGAFQDCYRPETEKTPALGLKSVDLSRAEGLVSIGAGAFSGDRLFAGSGGNLVFPEGLVSIEERAFANCRGLTSISFPASIREIGAQAFFFNTHVTSMEFMGDARPVTFGANAFNFYEGEGRGEEPGMLKSVTFHDKKAPTIESYVNSGTQRSRMTNHGRAYEIFYTVKFYTSESNFQMGKVSRESLVKEDAFGRHFAPVMPSYVTWRAEPGFDVNKITTDSYYAVAGYDIGAATVSGFEDFYYYTGNAIRPVPTLTMPDGTVLVEGRDYVRDTTKGMWRDGYTNNIRMGIASVYLVGIGNYAGTNQAKFSIIGYVDASSSFDAQVAGGGFVYSGQPIEPSVNVSARLRGEPYEVVYGEDYEVSYADNVNAGTGRAIVHGKGVFASSKEAEFTIEPLNIARCSVTDVSATVGEDGSVSASATLVNPYDVQLEQGRDFNILYYDLGGDELTLVIVGQGNYTGAISRYVAVGGRGDGGQGGGAGGGTGSGTGPGSGEGQGDSSGSGGEGEGGSPGTPTRSDGAKDGPVLPNARPAANSTAPAPKAVATPSDAQVNANTVENLGGGDSAGGGKPAALDVVRRPRIFEMAEDLPEPVQTVVRALSLIELLSLLILVGGAIAVGIARRTRQFDKER